MRKTYGKCIFMLMYVFNFVAWIYLMQCSTGDEFIFPNESVTVSCKIEMVSLEALVFKETLTR